jgi:RNAse (barnase) inhibitor barstar
MASVFSSENIQLDGKHIKSRDELQRILEKQLRLPINSAKNFDEVYNVLLADMKTESVVRIKHLEILKNKLGDQYIEDFIEVVNLAAEDNLHVILILE